MEIYNDFKKKGYFTSALYHLLVHKKNMPTDTEIIPSTYKKEMKLTAQERIQQLNNIDVTNLICTSDPNMKSVLEFTPRILVFQNVKPNEKVVAKFTVRNISRVSTFLNLVFKESSNFFIKPCGSELLSRLAAGIGVTFAVTFEPRRYEDYCHRVVFSTDKQQYAIPLIGMGPRPVFDFPDEIIVPPTPLKVESYSLLCVKNIGRIISSYTIYTKCPFAVKPKFCYNMVPDELAEAKVTFRSMHYGTSKGKLHVTCETDEIFVIKVSGTTYTVCIELEKAVVRFLDTYNTMVRQQAFKITNKSDQVISFMCMKNDSIFKDFEDKIKLATIFYDVKDSESAKYKKLVQYEVLSSDEHERVYTRIFFDEIQSLVMDESLYFNDMNFSIMPIKGKLWPHEVTTISMTFCPKEIGDFVAVAFLDIDGISDRVPLTMQGTSLPPNIHLHIEHLNMDNVYINKTYRYEVVAINKGHINGVIQYRGTVPLFGSVISCTPEKYCLRPGDKEVFVVSFLNSNQGPYFEELDFIILDTNLVRKLYLKGTVIYPTMTFSVPCLDFGNVNVGVSKSLLVDVINESEVTVNAILKISSDGPELSSVTLEDCEACEDRRILLTMPQWPKEFNIEPTKITMTGNSRMTLRVTLTPNLVRANQTVLELELEKSDSPPITLPISFNAQVPEITPAPDINLRACFLDFTYQYDIVLTSNEYWGFFIIDEPKGDNTLKVNVGIKSGIIRPNTTISLPVTIMTGVLGRQEYVVQMLLFGQPQPIDVCRITVMGVRPIVTCNPITLHWGHLKLLTRSYKTLTLANDSPVTVNFKAGILYNDGKWSIKPEEGYIDPEGETDLTLSLCLVDANTYTNKVVIHLEKVKDIFVPLSVIGVGTSIVIGKDRDHVNLGRHFIKFPMEVRVPIENCGSRLHSLEWTEHYKAPKTKELPPPFFNIEPRCLKICANEKSELRISGYSAKVGFMKEIWYLIGSVEGINKKELLMECEVAGEFVEPKVILSTAEINLQYDFGPYSEFYKLTDIVTIKNVSKLPLHLDISIKPPFAIVQRDTYIIEQEDADMCCCITYDEADLNLQKILEEAGQHEPPIFLDCITKKPIQRQRQGPLHFFQDIHKIKAAFTLTHSMDEKLEDQEIIKLQIVFDTTKHLNLKSKIYGDLMRVKFRGHKNKDAVRIIGKINFPNVIVYTPRVDFQCVLNGSIESKTIKISNPTGLMVCYKFQFKKWSLRKVELPVLSVMKIMSEVKVEEEVPTVAESDADLLQTSEIDAEQEKNMLEGRDSQIIPSPSLKTESSTHDSEMDFITMKTKFLGKITPMLFMEKSPGFQWAHKFNKQIKENSDIEINELLYLMPHYGMLSPGDTNYIQVIFRPVNNISVNALLECKVLGGPSEFTTITGQSSELIYKLNTRTLNFKIRSFHELASENLIITNMAKFVFEYKTYLHEPELENSLLAKICEIVPPEKVVGAEEEIEVAVAVRPGVTGYFNRTFLLEIGHLPHIPIEIFGWGVIPQVFFNLPRPGLAKLNVEIGYKAISRMSLEYLAAVNEILSRGTTAHLNSPQTEKCFEDPDLQEEWHICSAWDGYPTVMDIEMAIEQLLVVRHITSRPDIMNMCATATKVVPIPGFQTTPYLIDFGVIITGNSVSCSIDVTNYGPIPVKMYFHKSYVFRYWLNIKLCGKLNSGETSKLDITFAPDTSAFPELEQYLDMTFNLEVPYGVSIPLNVKALCAVPFLKSNISVLELGSVRCGDKIIASVPLANVGKPTCIWYVTLKIKSPGTSSMTILDNAGKYEPGESGWLTLAFKPTMEMLYEAVLIFRFHMNPTRLEIPVIGQGIFPHPHIIGPNVNFPPTLPWAQTTEIFFGITNPCPFPIELIIAHVDQKWKEEEDLFHLLYKYYNKPEEMLVPALTPGGGLPIEIYEFYDNFKINVQRGLNEESLAAAKLASTKGPAAKKVKSPKGKVGEKGKVDKDTSPARKIRNEAEVIADEIKFMKEAGLDPLKACLSSMEEEPVEVDKYAIGLLLFLHGSPHEEIYCKEMAYTLGMNLGIPTVNFDSCFIEALCVSNCNAKTIIMSALNENLESLRKNATKATIDSDVSDHEDPYNFGEHLDEFEIVMKKLDILATSKVVGTPRSKASDKKKKDISEPASHIVLGNANVMFQTELIVELLTDFFAHEKFQRGFVMDSLTSIIVKMPTLLLTTVLRCKNTIYNIHLVLCHSDFNKWAQAYEEALHEAELAEEQLNEVIVYNEDEIEDIVRKFEEMDDEEYENANPDLKAIYIKHGLEERKRKYFDKLAPPSVDMSPSKKEGKGMKDQSCVIPSDPSDVKKKVKRDDTKGKPGPEYFNAQFKYNDYQKNVYDILIQISNNWIIEECDMGFPLYGFNGAVLGATAKKSKKGKSEIHLVTDSAVTEEEPVRGFPLTIIMCPCLEYKTALLDMFKCPFIESKLAPPEKFNILELPVKKKEYTVLLPKFMPQIHHEQPLQWRFLDELPIRKCECNQITDLTLLDDTTQDNVLNILSKWHCVCGKKVKVASSQTSTTGLQVYNKPPSIKVEEEQEKDPYFYPLPLRSVSSITAPEERLVLEPGDLVRCKYAFNPQYEGNFSIKRYVEVKGWPESRVDINITGICDLPRLDNRPKKMFANFVRRTLEDEVYKLTYLDDQKKFEFGPIFIGPNRIYEEEYTIELKNASLLPVNVDIEFMDTDNIFQINKTFISLEPGCRDQLVVTAAPPFVGDHITHLLFCVKDNPEIVQIDISCSGVVPNVEVLPVTKLIDYGKLLLYRREDDRFIVKNDSILPIMWKVQNPEDFVEDFILSKLSGIVPRHENHVVPITYIACNVGIITQLPMTIEIYDELGRGDPMVVDHLWLSAECYDVMVECAYENPNESYLNFGNVKVNSTVYRDMFLLNRGKYNIYYKLKKVKNFPEPALLKSFECIPDCGIIPPNLRLVAIEFQCMPTTSMNLINVPAYTCSLLDGSKDQVVVAKFPVGVTIASFYNTFTLFPLGELNFHIIAVGSGVMREVILNNTSKCPFNYEIVLPPEYRVDVPLVMPSNVKDKNSKLKNPPLKCGNFMIVNEDNLLAPGESRTIQIQFLANAARTFEETIHFIVSDTCPAEASGVPLRLVGTGAMPILDFWNLENTFREHLIVKHMCEYKVPESSPHCVFVEDSVTLHFFCVTVNTSHTGFIDLYNNGVVPCILAMKMIYQTNTSGDIFSLSKNEMQIDPLMHKRLGITFSPKELQEYRAVLEIKLKLLHNQEQIFQLCLIGEGVIPRIRLIKPPIRQHRLALLTFPVTCLGSTSHKHLRFKNITSVNSTVSLKILQAPAERPVFWMIPIDDSKILNEKGGTEHVSMQLTLKPHEKVSIQVFFSPLVKGRTNCDVKIRILHNPYEHYTIMCEAEAFVEDVILIGLEMLSMDYDIEAMKGETGTVSGLSNDASGRKKSKSAPTDKQKSQRDAKSKFTLGPNGEILEPAVLKYLLDFGGCELCTAHKRSVVMLNNSEKVYKFLWDQLESFLIKPAVGYISPGEEKDIEITFLSALPVVIKRDLLVCNLIAISDEYLSLDSKGATWDNRQIQTVFEPNPETGQSERIETRISDPNSGQTDVLGFINIIILYSVTTEYTKYLSNLREETKLKDTYIYQKRSFTFKVENIGMVPLKMSWNFFIEDEYPGRIDRRKQQRVYSEALAAPVDPSMDESNTNRVDDKSLVPSNREGGSKETLFSGSMERFSVDTCLDVDIPFTIEPKKVCLNPQESQKFVVTFSPLDAFNFTVRLRSSIDNLDPYDQNLSCKIMARSLIPYVHLDLEENDYLWSGRRKNITGIVLPPHMQVLEFNVLGSGCYKKSFQVINPTSEAYEFEFVSCPPEFTDRDFIPVHCNMLKGYVEGGTSSTVTFTFTPTAPGVYESQWRFRIAAHNLQIPLMVVGFVREPDVVFVPTIMLIKNAMVGFTTSQEVKLKNSENEALSFEFKGDSLVNESGKSIIVVCPKSGTLKPNSETKIMIYYNPVQDGPLSFKIFCQIAYMTKYLTLCVNALSHLVKPRVTYYIIGDEHVLDYDVVTNIHLEQTASTYERTIPFKIKNNGSATFTFEWNYVVATVKKYLTVSVEPRTGYVAPAGEQECILHFNLKTVPVQAYPVTLTISDGPLYQIYLYAEIEKPLYHFSRKEYDFGKCIINAPHRTYKKNLAFTNDDKVPVTLDLATESTAELYLDCRLDPEIQPKQRVKIPIYFRPNAVQQYEFKIQFWVNSLCEENIIIRGEGVSLMVDIYEGCQRSFDLGPVKVGEKIVREIDVFNHSKVAIDARFVFKEVYPNLDKKPQDDLESLGTSICIDPSSGDATSGPSRTKCVKAFRDEEQQRQIEGDIKNALASVKVVPNKAVIQPHRKIPLKIQFKPVGMISQLNIQLDVVVLEISRPLVLLSGSATGMSLCFSQNSLQFGRVRRRGCKVLKVMLYNKGDFGTNFCWQPFASEEFSISPMQGIIAAKTNITFTVTFRPLNYNPFVKVWAICNIENYTNLELALYAACVDVGVPQNQSIYIECPVREVGTDYVIVTNPTDETWLVLSEFSEETASFETLREFYIESNSVFDIPIIFKPKTAGKHEAQVLFSPLGESALFVTCIGVALHPNPNGVINLTLEAKKSHTEPLMVFNITEKPEMYLVTTELVNVVPDKFDGYYEIKYPDTVRVWGEAKGTCLWTFICFEPCDMFLKVMFVNEATREYQFYEVNLKVTPSQIVDTLKFTCRARECVQQDLTVRNPLAEDSDFQIVSQKLLCAETVRINKNSETQLTMTYTPLVVGEFEDFLTITNYLIGTYTYRVVCICKPAKEKSLEFSTALGTMIPIRLRVHNKSNVHATFISSVSHPSIILEKNYELQAFTKGKFLVYFEPVDLGVQNIKVIFDSDIAGQYVFNIKGIGLDPKPQGPYDIKTGGYASIKFKNVFEDTRTFRVFVDREDFYVKQQMEQIKPKKEIRVQVYLSEMPVGGWAEPPTGCLTIENFEPAEPKVHWTYFLQGIP